MKKSFTIVYSVIVSLILIFAITFFSVNIYNENEHGSLRTQVRFEKMASAVMNTLDKNNISTGEQNRQIENAIGDTKDFAYIKIISESKTVYVFPQDYEEAKNGSSKLIISYNKRSGQNLIEAGLYSLRPGTIFNYAKISFFIILIVSLITIILIIYTNNFDKGTKRIKVSDNKKLIVDEDETYEDETYEDETYEDETYEQDEEDFEEADDAIDDNVEEDNIKDDNNIESEEVAEAEQTPASPVNAELPTQDFEPAELQEEASEKGLFSPDTGLGWESYLMTRLDNELNRATASELDLALFVIKIAGISRTDSDMKKICDYLIVEFQFKDLLFEYKDDSVCAIKISMSIDAAVEFGEKIAGEIKALTGNNNLKVYIGITTRGIRMVTGERLLKEAGEAVLHAMDDESCPVVGFRADAVKYRKFIETK